MDPEENYALTQSLVSDAGGTLVSDVTIPAAIEPPRRRCYRIRNMPTLFFIVTPMIIFIGVMFLSTALIPTSSTTSKAPTLQDRMVHYLTENMMPYDGPNSRTLGFSKSKHQSNVDGLSDSLVNETVYYSVQAKELYPWTDSIPEEVFMEYVVPFAVVNEPRTFSRFLLFNGLKDSLEQYERRNNNTTQSAEEQIKDVVKLVNTKIWSIMGRNSKEPIVFKASQTPRIYDPLSVIAYGYASCTGLSIFLVQSLRSIGIPARLAGTPAWWGDQSKGDHSWVEVYVPSNQTNSTGQWLFLEPTPGIAEGNESASNADNLDRNPCERWFCKAERFNGSTKTFATRYDRQATQYFPMAWSDGDKGVPGEERTKYYSSTCGKCK